MYKLKRSAAKLQQEYKTFNIYNYNEDGTPGTFITTTPLVKLAVVVCNRAEEQGSTYCITGVKTDGTEALLERSDSRA